MSAYITDAQLIPAHDLTARSPRISRCGGQGSGEYIAAVNELVGVDRVRFAFLAYAAAARPGVPPSSPEARRLFDYVTGVNADFDSVKNYCCVVWGASADDTVLEILYVMRKFDAMRRIFKVCKHRAGRLFESPRRINKVWRDLANFCEACLDGEAGEILRHFLPESSSTAELPAEAMVLLLYENGVITSDGYVELREYIKTRYDDEELLEHLCDTARRYPMVNSPHGFAIILNHNNFNDPKNETKLADRDGTKKDVELLSEMWAELDFMVRVYEDLTADGIERLLSDVATVWNHTNSDALVVVILSHGYRGGFYAQDCKKVDLETIESFLCDRCEALKKKPKILCVQACQNGDSRDEPRRSSTEASNRADVLKFMSTVPNSVSYRDPHCGSVFVRALVNAVRRHWRNYDLAQIGTFINSDVAETPIPVVSGDSRQLLWASQTSELRSTLTRALYLTRE